LRLTRQKEKLLFELMKRDGRRGENDQAKPARSPVRAGGRLSADTGRRHLDSTGTERIYDLTGERHDWMMPTELP
jgi:hypothetical protein